MPPSPNPRENSERQDREERKNEERDEGYREDKKLLKYMMESLKEGQERIEAKQDKLEADITKLKIKAGIWGAVMGFIGAAIPLCLDVALRLHEVPK